METSEAENIKLETVTVSDKGQIAIPKRVRENLSIKKGDKLIMLIKGNRILIEKSSSVAGNMENEFDYLVKLSEQSARKIWDNESDEVWNNV